MKKILAVVTLLLFLALSAAVSYHCHCETEPHSDCVICLLAPSFNFIFSCPPDNLNARPIFLFIIAVYGFIKSTTSVSSISSRSPPLPA